MLVINVKLIYYLDSGSAHITMNVDDNQEPYEVFVEIGKGGSDIKAMAEAMGRLMSLVLRMNADMTPKQRVEEISKQLMGIGGKNSYGFGKNRVLSLPDAVGQALKEHYLDNDKERQQETKDYSDTKLSNADICPSCGDTAFMSLEGCHTCLSCGYSQC